MQKSRQRRSKSSEQRHDRDKQPIESAPTSDFAKRLRTVLIGKDATEVAEEIGVSRASFYKWLGGKFEPSLAKLAALGSIANVSLDWLITGRGEPHPADLPGYIKPTSPIQPEPLAFERKWLEANAGAKDKADVTLIEVQDGSMEPTLRQGDLLLGLRSSLGANGIYICGRTRSEPGEKILINWIGDDSRPIKLRNAAPGEDVTYTFLLDSKGKLVNRLFARRVEWTSKPSAIIKCDNPAYPLVIETSPENDQGIAILARAVWHGRLM